VPHMCASEARLMVEDHQQVWSLEGRILPCLCAILNGPSTRKHLKTRVRRTRSTVMLRAYSLLLVALLVDVCRPIGRLSE
jgi:hypothetical protein